MSHDPAPIPSPPQKKAHDPKRRTAVITAAIGLFMLGLAFASKPLYDTFCRVTGYGGTTQVAKAGPRAILTEKVEVRFDANAAGALALNFKPLKTHLDLRFGQIGLAFFEVSNPTDRPIKAIANYNVTPHSAGRFFQKLECFCFAERTFQPGETAQLPVLFYVDPEMLSDREARKVSTITLSYTYFEVGDPGFELASTGEQGAN